MTKKLITYYVASGPIRGGCRHKHRTPESAEKCRVKDAKACKKQGGYSDRVVLECQEGGW